MFPVYAMLIVLYAISCTLLSYIFCEIHSRANEVLNTETQMFEKYLKRVEPKDWEKMLNTPQNLLVSSTPSASTNDLISGGRVTRKRSKSRSSTTDRVLKLTAEQKCDIAQREIEEFREEIEKLREDSEKVLDNFRVCLFKDFLQYLLFWFNVNCFAIILCVQAVMEEGEVRFAELRKASYEFERDIVKGSVNARTGKVVAEKVQRYLEDKLRSRVS